MVVGAPGAQRAVRVYSGEGAGRRSIKSTVASLQAALAPPARPTPSYPPPVAVECIGPEELLEGAWEEATSLLVMPGGADLPYCKRLNGRGNARIRGFVEGGGAYLGLCAGAYYASGRVEFEVGSALEVVGDRELDFFPGVARGSVFPGCAKGTTLLSLPHSGAQSHNARLKVFHYASEHGAVCARMRYTPGGAGADAGLEACCRAYVNGGPVFEAADGSDPEGPGWPGVEVIARFDEDAGAGDEGRGARGGVAALSCRVGDGVAVLCSAHPELDSSWLSPGRLGENDGGPGVEGVEWDERYCEHLRALHAAMEDSEEGRQSVWRALLAACGLSIA